MGANSRRRREARRRRAGKQQRTSGTASGSGAASRSRSSDSATARRTDQYLQHAVEEVQRSLSRSTAARQAAFLQAVLPADAPLVPLLATRLRRAHRAAVTVGWTAAEVEQAIERRAGESARLMLGVAAGKALPLPISHADLTDGLRVLALLRLLPPGLPDGRGSTSHADEEAAKQLARVRALLAKAESTEFTAEAEALCAKAQQLISTHSLTRLLDRAQDDGTASSVTTGRIWLDPPYVLAKATLVHEVARANRCRSVVSEQLALCTVVGDRDDLAFVDLLVTSLLIQGHRAMVAHGSRDTGVGQSRTRAFRKSFLMAFAARIGERLTHVGAAMVDASCDREQLLPVLAGHEQQVESVYHLLFPLTGLRATTASDLEGLAAGRVAADLADLDVRERLPGDDA